MVCVNTNKKLPGAWCGPWTCKQEERRNVAFLDSEFYLMQLLVLRTVLALISHWPANWLLCLAFILNSQTIKFERNFPCDLNV